MVQHDLAANYLALCTLHVLTNSKKVWVIILFGRVSFVNPWLLFRCLFKKLFEILCRIISDNGNTMTHYKYNNNKTLQVQCYIQETLQYDKKS